MAFTKDAKADYIAIVMHDFSTGGSERVAIRLANQWARNGRRVTIFCGISRGPVRPLVAEGIDVQQAAVETPRGMFSRFLLRKRLARQVRMAAPDILFPPGNFHMPVLFWLFSFLGRRRPPFICKISNPIDGLGRFFKKLDASRVDTFVAMSEALAQDARRVLGRARIVTIPEPILDAMPDAAKRDQSSNIVLCIGRLVEQKNFCLRSKPSLYATVPIFS